VEEVTLGIEADGTTANALTGLLGQPAEYYDFAAEVTGVFDTVVGTSIDFVDQLGWGYPPTHRTRSTREWGPNAIRVILEACGFPADSPPRAAPEAPSDESFWDAA
jgi:hypothetical protein